jgi:predicted ATPase/class 3 adenylate cyclase
MDTKPTGTVTFLFTDIEGSTRLWERSPEAMKTALQRHDDILRDVIEASGGTIINKTGDGCYAAFETPLAAMRAAVRVQQLLRDEPWEQTVTLRVRMAIHTGSADERDGDYFGSVVNRTARIMAAGHGGQILLSLSTYTLLRAVAAPSGDSAGSFHVTFRDLGEHRLRDLAEPERIFQIVLDGLVSDFPPLRTLSNRPNNLPGQPNPLVGRGRDVQLVRELLLRDDVRLVTLTGSPGVGKTRLGLEVARTLLDPYEDGVFLVSFDSTGGTADVPWLIMKTLDLEASGDSPSLQRLKERLRDKRMLLVLDSFERVVDAAPLVGELLDAARRLKILVCSRALLRIYGERVFPLSPLALPLVDARPAPAELEQVESVRLFLQRARDHKPDFTLTPANAAAVAAICGRLDGLPLALELAAARVRLLTPEAILARLSMRLRFLTRGARDLPERHQSLRRAIDWSHDLLETEERRLFRRLSLFAGGFTLDAAEALSEGDEKLEFDVLASIESLVEQSLLQLTAATGDEPRFTMLETMREYALERLWESGEAVQTKHSHACYFLQVAEEAAPRLRVSEQLEWLARLDAERENLYAALTYARDGANSEVELRLVTALSWYWHLRGMLDKGLRHLEEALAQPGAADQPAHIRAPARSRAGLFAMLQGALPQAREYLEESIVLYRQFEDPRGLGFALCALAIVLQFLGQCGDARDHLEEAESLFESTGDLWVRGWASLTRGFVLLREEDLEGARAAHEQSLETFRTVGDTWFTATSLNNLADVIRAQGDYVPAGVLYRESLALFHDIGSKRDQAAVLRNLGHVAFCRGSYLRAEEHFEESLRWHAEIGNREGITECIAAFAMVAAARGDLKRGARLLGAAHALREVHSALLWPAALAGYTQTLETVRAGMGARAFQEEWAEGRTLLLEQAVAYALSRK